VRRYRAGAADGPVVAFFHGGGWMSGDLDTHDGLCRAIAARAGALVLSVDYRRTPEHRFPRRCRTRSPRRAGWRPRRAARRS